MILTDSMRVAVIGAGAVGGYFGGMMARAGIPVVMIGREGFVTAVRARGLILDTVSFRETVTVESSTELSAARGADLVLFCVKTTDTVKVAQQLAGHLAPGATLLCLQNGVDNADRIQAATSLRALTAVVYVAASVPEPGIIKHVGRGDLVIGPTSPMVERVADLCARAQIPCRVSANVQGELWTKFLCNCALNAVSALSRARYGEIAANPATRGLVAAVVKEVMAVARASKLVLPGIESDQQALDVVLRLIEQISGAYSSTAQDLRRGKPTEIDSLNGYIAQRGLELGIPTPLNQALATLVKMAEVAGAAP